MKGFFEHQYLKFKKRHLKNLAAIAYADGVLHKSEKALLYKIGEKYGLKGWQIAKIIENQKGFKLEIPENNSKKLDVLYDLIEMMLADHVISEEEMELCQEAAKAFGFQEDIIFSIIKLFKKGDVDIQVWKSFKFEVMERFKTSS